MGTLGGFPNPPALWLRRAKLAYANAADGNPGRVPKGGHCILPGTWGRSHSGRNGESSLDQVAPEVPLEAVGCRPADEQLACGFGVDFTYGSQPVGTFRVVRRAAPGIGDKSYRVLSPKGHDVGDKLSSSEGLAPVPPSGCETVSLTGVWLWKKSPEPGRRIFQGRRGRLQVARENRKCKQGLRFAACGRPPVAPRWTGFCRARPAGFFEGCAHSGMEARCSLQTHSDSIHQSRQPVATRHPILFPPKVEGPLHDEGAPVCEERVTNCTELTRKRAKRLQHALAVFHLVERDDLKRQRRVQIGLALGFGSLLPTAEQLRSHRAPVVTAEAAISLHKQFSAWIPVLVFAEAELRSQRRIDEHGRLGECLVLDRVIHERQGQRPILRDVRAGGAGEKCRVPSLREVAQDLRPTAVRLRERLRPSC
jgi:hypothetical protein